MPSKSELAQRWPVYRPKKWGEPVKHRALARPWYGMDTERDAKTGEFVCGWAVGEDTFRFEGLEDFPPGTYWVWNLAYDIEGVLRDGKDPEGWAARADGARFRYKGGTAVYYHGKRFDWKPDGGGKRVFLEASSFFGRVPLKQIGSKDPVDAAAMSLERYRTDGEYRRTVDRYCQKDARIVYEAVSDLDMGTRAMGVDIGATPGATARRYLTRMGEYPRVLWATHQAFLKSYCGGRFEIVKRGVFHDVRQYDIVSAYPWALSNCPWLTGSAYHRRTRRVNDEALYGSYQVRFEDGENYLGLSPEWKGGVRVYSNAQGKTWLTKPEVEYLRERGADFKILKGVEIFDENATGLWGEVIQELFQMKRQNKGQPEGMGAKIVLNSMYGILIQLVRKSGKWVPMNEAQDPVDFAGTLALERPPEAFEGGKYYAPVYAGHLTALTRVKLLEAAEAVGPEHYIGGHTDSILTTAPLKKGLGPELGGWELEEHADRADICKTGMYAIGDKVKMRGITREGTSEILWTPTHQRKTRVGIKSAKDWEDVSVIRPKRVANNFTVENKRYWLRDLDRALIEREEWIDSEALAHV